MHDTLLTISCKTLLKLPLEYNSEGRKDHTTEDEDIEMEEEDDEENKVEEEEEENSDDSMTIPQSGLGLNL
jgi:hypothetical protein